MSRSWLWVRLAAMGSAAVPLCAWFFLREPRWLAIALAVLVAVIGWDLLYLALTPDLSRLAKLPDWALAALVFPTSILLPLGYIALAGLITGTTGRWVSLAALATAPLAFLPGRLVEKRYQP